MINFINKFLMRKKKEHQKTNDGKISEDAKREVIPSEASQADSSHNTDKHQAITEETLPNKIISNQRPLAPAIKGDPGIKSFCYQRIWFPEDLERMNSMDIDEKRVYRRGLIKIGRYSLKDKESGKIVKQCNEEFKYGDAPALLQVGLCHANGTDLPKDDAKAAEFFCKAAEQGLANAQCCLAECYYNGFGVKQDYAEAAKWFSLAAEQGVARAQGMLGMCYMDGIGVQKDYAKAIELYRSAAEQGETVAQALLGRCYYYGEGGVSRDYAKALRWIRPAAERGNAGGQTLLGKCYCYGQGVAQDYAKAVMWFRLAAEQGAAEAQFFLGACYHDGYGVKTDLDEAEKWYQKASEQGVFEANKRLKFLYMQKLMK